MYGYNVSIRLISGWCTRCLMILWSPLFVSLIYLSARTIIWLRQNFLWAFYQTQRERIGGGVEEEEEAEQPEFTNPQPQTVEFSVKKTFQTRYSGSTACDGSGSSCS